jgi:hypothetical protein
MAENLFELARTRRFLIPISLATLCATWHLFWGSDLLGILFFTVMAIVFLSNILISKL